MKSVLISIQPKWVEKICHKIGGKNGKPIYEKRIEVRKTKPKCEVPFKCYIYETKALYKPNGCKCLYVGKGKVIGEFLCDEVFPIRVFENGSIQDYNWHNMSWSCVPYEDISNYIGRDRVGYGWSISNLKIYDKPRELSEFYTLKKCAACEGGYESSACIYDEECKVPVPITRPFQSWGYVYESDN